MTPSNAKLNTRVLSIGRAAYGSVKADRGWNRAFEDPIPLARGRQLVTLQDVASYVMKLPKVEQNIRGSDQE